LAYLGKKFILGSKIKKSSGNALVRAQGFSPDSFFFLPKKQKNLLNQLLLNSSWEFRKKKNLIQRNLITKDRLVDI